MSDDLTATFWLDSTPKKISTRIDTFLHKRRHELFPTFTEQQLSEERRFYCLTITNEDDEFIAIMQGSFIWGWAHVHTLFVDSFSRSDGMGTDMLEDLEKLIKENHPDLLGIMLETSTEKNVEFYTKCGFIVHGSLEDFPPGSIKYYLSKRF